MAFLTKRNGFYHIAWRDEKGKRHLRSTKSKMKADANAALRRFYTEGDQEQERRKISLEDYIEVYIRLIGRTHTPDTIRLYRYVLKSFINFTGNKLMNQLNIDDIEKYREIKSDSLKDTSINIHLRHLKAFLNTAYEGNYIYRSWHKKIKFKKLSEKSRTSILREDINLIIEKAVSPVMKEVILYGNMTGSRRKEIINLTWENIDFGKRTITIRNSDTFQTKSKKNRIIPLNRTLDEMLRGKYLQEQILDRKDYVFKFNGKQINSDYVTRNFARTARGLGYGPEITFHSLRHSFITNLITTGTDINTVKELAGHSSITTSSQYIHTTNEIKRRAVEML